MARQRFLASLETTLKDLCATTSRMGATRVEVACGARFDAIKIGQFRRAGIALVQGVAGLGAGVRLTVVRDGKPYTIPCETYDRTLDNLRAAQRGLTNLYQMFEDYQIGGGGVDAFDLLFGAVSEALAKLAAPDDRKPWHTTLGLPPDADERAIRRAHARLALLHHPDRGGDSKVMSEVNAARDEGLRLLAAGR